jgi:hypothetical protein
MALFAQSTANLQADMNIDASSSDEDDDGYDYDPEVTLGSIQRSMTINFSIRANYTNWKPREAFRELVQNWYVVPGY